LAPEGRPAAPPAPTETPPAPPTETTPQAPTTPEEQAEIDRVVETIQGLQGLRATRPEVPHIKTPAERREEVFREAERRMTPEQRAQAAEYRHNVTDKMKQDLVDGKITIYEFMSKAGGGKTSAQDIKDALEGRSTLANIFGGSQLAQGRAAVQGLQQTIRDYQKGIASDRQLQQAYTNALTKFDTARAEYERNLHQSYQTAQQREQQRETPRVADVPPAAPFTMEPFATGPDVVYPSPPESVVPMTPTPPLDIRPPGAPGGIIPFGPDPNVDYYSVPPYAPPVAPVPPTVVPPVTPPVTVPPVAPPAVPPTVSPPAAPVAPAPAAPQVAAAPAPSAAPYYPPSYFESDANTQMAQQVQTMMRRNPTQVAALMDANPQLGMMLASIFTPDQLSQMFADAGFSHGEPNPPPRRDQNQQQQNQAQGQAQGGLVDMPGYYQRGGSDDLSYEERRALYEAQFPDIGRQFRVNPRAWDRWLASRPESENIEDRRNQPVPDESRYFDMPTPYSSPVYRHERGGLVPLHRARGGGLGPDYLKGEAEEAEENSKMLTRSLTPEEQAKPFGFAGGGLTLGAMNTLSGQAHYTGLNTQRAIPKRPDIHLISSATPGRVDRIPMRARTGSYVLPADVVSGFGQGNTAAGAKMWGQSISHSIGPMGIQNAIKQRSLKMPSLRMPSSQPSSSVYGLNKIPIASAKGPSWPFAQGGETEFTPIVTAGGEIVIDPEIVAALGDGDADVGKKMLADSVEHVRKQTIQHMKQLPGPVK
jgi:hypothetical protein